MSFSTPIHQLRSNNVEQPPMMMPGINTAPQQQQQQDNHNQLMDDILKDIGPIAGEGNQSNISSSSFQYATDPSLIPSNVMGAPPPPPEETRVSSSMSGQQQQYYDGSSLMPVDKSWKDSLYELVKLPLTVFLVCVLISEANFNRILFTFLPSLLLENGQVGWLGIMLKALIGTLIYLAVKYFL